MTKITTTNKTLAEVPAKYCRVVLTEDKATWHRLVETVEGHLEYQMGAGKRTEATPHSFRTLVRTIVRTAKAHQLEYIAIYLGTMGCPKLEAMGEEWFWRTLAENVQLAQYEFTKYKTKKKETKALKEILVCGVGTPAEKRSFSAGLTIGEAINLTRDIANTTSEDMTPAKLAVAAKALFAGTKATVKVLNTQAIKKEKMGLLEAVGKGAAEGSQLIVVEYWGAGKSSKTSTDARPIILVGKGITYDTGGLNLKPGNAGSMHLMHMDMTGGATVLGAIKAAVDLGVKQNIVGIIPVAENAVSDRAMRMGDIITSMSGKTVEVVHTDAEGRLILADALTYAQKYYTPRVILDVATLTGASMVALGQQASAVMGNNDAILQKLQELSEVSGDRVWPFPLWDEYKALLNNTRADLSNMHPGYSRYGGCIEGGAFLSHFVAKDIAWAHIDIAPRMESIPSDKLAKGATGEPVRLLVKFVEEY